MGGAFEFSLFALTFLPLVALVWLVATVLSLRAVARSRLEDYERFGWYVMIALLPIIGVVIWLVYASVSLRSTRGASRRSR